MKGQAVPSRLASLAGLVTSYQDAWGETRQVPEAAQRALLAAMGITTETAGRVKQSIRDLEEAPWRRPLAPVLVVKQKGRDARASITINLPAGQTSEILEWRFVKETGETREGTLKPSDLPLQDKRLVDGKLIERRLFTLPFAAELGYHKFQLQLPSAAGGEATLPLYVVPPRCYLPRDEARRRMWGLTLQLYAVRSARNWGVGDFTDLAQMVDIVAKLQGAAVGVNPMHTLFPERPAHASPYSPSHRQFLSLVYLDIEAIADFAECEAAQNLVRDKAFAAKLDKLRQTELVDYAGAGTAKRQALELLYRSFRETHLESRQTAESVRGAEFRRFQQEKGAALNRLATFQALSEHFAALGSWQHWPAKYRDPASPDVETFGRERNERVEFFEYAQWQAQLQLRTARDKAARAGMAIGLYHDLALAADRSGAEAWANQRMLAPGTSLGAPPDPWNLNGQNWGLPPYNPRALKEAAYQPFIAVMRANMEHGGALRIDHFLGLERMYWIADGHSPQDGGYVRYPFDDLIGIIALESERHKCVVIGEDLGTVPPGLQQRMRAAAILSYRLLYFSQDAEGAFLEPSEYPALSAVAVATHDLATLRGYWTGRDVAQRAKLGLYPFESQETEAVTERAAARKALLRALKAADLLPSRVPDESTEWSFDLVQAVHRFLARTPARLLLVQLEDILGEEDQMNMPGTVDEYPNWRRKLTSAVETLGKDPRLESIATALRSERAVKAAAKKSEGP